jgi:tripartite-type tricarboxylate transporter receptor subunit TctC
MRVSSPGRRKRIRAFTAWPREDGRKRPDALRGYALKRPYVPAISLREALSDPYQDGRNKTGHDNRRNPVILLTDDLQRMGVAMKLPRRRFLRLAAGAAALPLASRLALAQAYPSRPVRIIVPVAPGGALDILARIMGQWLSERLGQSVVIENRPGAGTNIGIEAAVRAAPDGYTLLLIPASVTTNATLYQDLTFNFIRDIEPVAMISTLPMVMEINPQIPAKTVAEFIAYAKANPGKISMASGGSGSSSHVGGELFKMLAGIDMIHVPYRGGAPALADLIGGQVQVMFSPLPESLGAIRSGQVRALGVASAKRVEALPDVPTVAETVPGFEASTWQGIGAPKGTPPEIIERLNRQINAALADPKIKGRLADLGSIPTPMSPADFKKLIVAETEKWAKVIRTANITLQGP